MNKLLKSVVAASVGVAMAIGVGVAAANRKATPVNADDVTYKFTITEADFNATSYAANNNEKTSTAVCTSDNTKTMSVKWTSNQVYQNSGVMQWQKNTAYIYNSTNLGTISSVVVTSTAGTFTTYYGVSEQPSSGTSTGSGKGFFKTSCGNATGKTSKIEITFVITEGGNTPELTGLVLNNGTPTRTSYYAGESFEPAGLVVYAEWDGELDTSENIATSLSWAPNPLTTGTTSVRGTYGEEYVDVSGITVSAYKEVSVTSALEIINGLANNASTAYKVRIVGYVTGIVTAWSDEYSNISYNLADESGSTPVIEAFRSTVSDAEYGPNLAVGDKVEVIGNLTKYGTTSEITNCVTTLVEPGTVPEVDEPAVAERDLVDFINGENTKVLAYYVTGTVKDWGGENATKNQYGNMTLTDGENDLYIYGACVDSTALEWDHYTTYVFANKKDFLTNATTIALDIGYQVTMKLIRSDYNGNVQGVGLVISVQAPTATSITMSDDSLDLEQGTSANLTATVVPASLSSSVVWSIWPEDGKVTVDQNGKVTAAADAVVGAEYTVTAVVGSLDDTCDITVVASSLPADAVTVSKTVAQLKEENSWANGVVVKSLTIGKVDVTLTGDNGDAKYYDSGSNLRVYVLKNGGVGSVSFAAKTGYKIISVAVTYGWDKNTGSFELVSEEVTTVNNTSASYAIENPGSSNEQLRITAFTIVYTTDSSADPVEAHLSSATSVATIHGAQNPVSEPTTKSLNFEDIGATNGTKISDTYIGVVKLSGAKGDHQSSVPAFYDDQIRVYAGNTITFESTHEITSIVLNFGTGTFESFSVLEDEGTFDEDGWAGSAYSVTFKNVSESTVKLNSVSVTTADSISVGSVKLRFGLTIPKDEWDAIQGISDYGVMVVRKETLVNTYGCSSVEEAYNGGKNVNIFNTGSSEAPYLDGDNYLFTARINMTKVSNYNVVFCAAPFVVVNGQYHFLEEKEASVYSLAQYYLDNGGSEYLPNEALSLLSGRLGD